MAYDVVTLGETMIRYSPPNGLRLEQASAFEAHIGGSESNMAVGLARLGLRAAWLSRLTDNVLGRMIAGTLTRCGLDTSHIVWTNADRVGTYYYEPEVPPRPAQVIYDRANSAFARWQPDDLPADVFQPGGARLLHLSGITLAAGVGGVAQRALERARQAGWRFSFDVNHRARLMNAAEARAHYDLFAAQADVLFIAEKDAETVYDLGGRVNDIIARLAERFPHALIVLTRGASGAVARTLDGAVLPQSAFPCTGVDRLGRGDAFAAGFLYGYLNDLDVGLCLRWGAAMAAVKYTIPGDLPLVDLAQIRALVDGSPTRGTFR
jgi:2-dehydro-3-deoxygluconokinase